MHIILTPHRKAGESGVRPVCPTYTVVTALVTGFQASLGSTGWPTPCPFHILTADMQGIYILRHERASAESVSKVTKLGHVPRAVVLTGKVVSGTLGKLRTLGGVCRAW